MRGGTNKCARVRLRLQRVPHRARAARPRPRAARGGAPAACPRPARARPSGGGEAPPSAPRRSRWPPPRSTTAFASRASSRARWAWSRSSASSSASPRCVHSGAEEACALGPRAARGGACVRVRMPPHGWALKARVLFFFVHRSASFCCNDVRCVPLPCGRRASARRVRDREIMRVRVRGRAHARAACQPFASRSGTGTAPLRVRPFGHQVHAWRLPKMSRGACGPANLSPRARAAPREQCASRAGRARAPRRRVCVREECISTARCVID